MKTLLIIVLLQLTLIIQAVNIQNKFLEEIRKKETLTDIEPLKVEHTEGRKDVQEVSKKSLRVLYGHWDHHGGNDWDHGGGDWDHHGGGDWDDHHGGGDWDDHHRGGDDWDHHGHREWQQNEQKGVELKEESKTRLLEEEDYHHPHHHHHHHHHPHLEYQKGVELQQQDLTLKEKKVTEPQQFLGKKRAY